MSDIDITLKSDVAEFGVRAVAVFLHEGHVLLHQSHGETIWNLPGGRVHLLETTEAALRREMLEELNEVVSVGPLQWTVETFHDLGERRYHEIGFYYASQFHNATRYDKATTFHGMEGETLVITYRWFPISQIDEVPNMVPPFLYQALKELPGGPRHLVDRR